jgi:membrane associated rhomboid family serine protease
MAEFRMGRFGGIPPVVKNLIIINALVYLAQVSLDSSLGITDKIALYNLSSSHFKGYQIFTHMFARRTISHSLNMLALWMFGSVLRIYGGEALPYFTWLAASALQYTWPYSNGCMK